MRRSIRVVILVLACFSASSLVRAAQPTESTSSAPNATELLRRATVAFEAGDLAVARDLYAELRGTEPENPAGWFGGGLAAESSGDLDSALELLSRAAELDPERPAVHLARGRILARSGVSSPALVALARARELDPLQPDGYLFAALLLRDLGRYAESEKLLREGIARAEPRPESWDQLGLVLLSQQKPEAALLAVEDFLSRYPTTPRIELVRGLALAKDPERRREAIASLEQAIAGREGGALARIQLADLLLSDQRLEDAIVQLTAAVATAPANPEAHYRLGQALQQAGRREEATAALDRFQELRQQRDTKTTRAKRLGTRLNTAIDHLQANRLEDALAAVEDVLAEAPDHARTLALKAKILFSKGDVAGALEAAVAARRADPSVIEHHYLEGLFSYRLGKLGEARKALDRALALDPDLGEAHEVAALVAYRLDQPAEAVAHFERALALGLDHPELRRAYALALEAAADSGE